MTQLDEPKVNIRLVESYRLDPSIEDKAADALAELISNSDSGTGYIAFEMGCRDDPYGETDAECWEREFPDWCKSAVFDAFHMITGLFKGDKLPIWRVITAPANWRPKRGDHPGIYWSWDQHAAEAHWGEFGAGHVEWMLSAEVTFNQIDWVGTLAKNAMPDFADEKEITVTNDLFPFKFRRKA